MFKKSVYGFLKWASGSRERGIMENRRVLTSEPPNELSKTSTWRAIEKQEQELPGCT